MDIRKIAAISGLTAGAAFAFAPLAAADPVEITSTVDSEVSSLNSSFSFDALLAGDSSDVTTGTPPLGFDTITPADIAAVQGTGATSGTTTFDYLIYGADPTKAGLSTDPGAYDVLNGADIKFDDAYNVALYALENNGALDPNSATDFFGASIPAADTTAPEAFEYFYNFAIGDLSGFFNTDLSSLDISAQSATELFSLLGSL